MSIADELERLRKLKRLRLIDENAKLREALQEARMVEPKRERVVQAALAFADSYVPETDTYDDAHMGELLWAAAAYERVSTKEESHG